MCLSVNVRPGFFFLDCSCVIGMLSVFDGPIKVDILGSRIKAKFSYNPFLSKNDNLLFRLLIDFCTLQASSIIMVLLLAMPSFRLYYYSSAILLFFFVSTIKSPSHDLPFLSLSCSSSSSSPLSSSLSEANKA